VARRKSPAISDVEWQAIARAIGPIPPTADVARARLEIGACRRDYARLPISRSKLRGARAEFRRIDALWKRLIRSYETAQRQTSAALLLADITKARKLRMRAQGWHEGFNTLARRHAGNRDVAREWLYERVLGIWTDCLGGKLVTSTARRRVPYGPLVRFFDAIVRPLLGDKAPGPHAIRGIVKQEKRQRQEATRRLVALRQKYGDGAVRVFCPPKNKFQNSI
jgi:hypothetical protein